MAQHVTAQHLTRLACLYVRGSGTLLVKALQ